MSTKQSSRRPTNSLYCIRQSQLSQIQPEPVSGFQRFVTSIVANYGYQLAQPDLNLQLHHPAKNVRLVVATLYEETIMLARMYGACGYWLENMLVIAQVKSEGWVTEEVRYSYNVWNEYTRSTLFNRADSHHSLLTVMAEFITGWLRAEHWLEQGIPVDQADDTVMAMLLGTKDVNGTIHPDADIWK